MSKIKEFKEILVPLENLLLDPNNPRFSIKKDEYTSEDEFEDDDIQTLAYKEMIDKKNNFEIVELASSIKTKGFYPIDKIFVRKIGKKYLIIEGNRRITAIKYLVEKEERGAKKDNLEKSITDSFQDIKCVDLSGEDEDGINLILGLRHHGSIKEWKLLPSSFNLFTRYMKEYCKKNNCDENDYKNFVYDTKTAEKVGDLFSIKRNEVREKLMTYRIYLQLLDENVEIENDKFSIINETIKRVKMREHFGFDAQKCVFSDDGVEKFIDVCIGANGKKPIITQASAGESNVRDYEFVIKNSEHKYIQKIEEERESASSVKGQIKDKSTQRDVINTLEKIKDVIGKIEIKDINELTDEENKLIKNIEDWIATLKRASHK